MSQMKCRPDARLPEERLLQQDGNSPWYRANHRGSMNRAGMVRNEQTSPRWNSLRARDANTYSDCAHKKHHAANSGPIQRIGIFGNDGVDEQRNSSNDDV